jgi:hypothetical protein
MTTVLIAFACFLVGFVAGGLLVRWAIFATWGTGNVFTRR